MDDSAAEVKALLHGYASARDETTGTARAAVLLAAIDLRDDIERPANASPIELVDRLIRNAIDDPGFDPRRRGAVEAMLLVGPDRWSKLHARYKRAANAMGLTSASGFTRRNRGRPAHYEQVLEEVAAHLVGASAAASWPGAEHPAEQRTVVPAPRVEPLEPPGEIVVGRPPRRGAFLVAAGALIVGGVAIGGLVLLRDDESSAGLESAAPTTTFGARAEDGGATATTAAPVACAVPPAVPGQALGATDAERVEALASDMSGLLADHECAAAPVGRFVQALTMEVLDGGKPAGVVIVAPAGDPVRLTQAQWSTYKEIAGRGRPENAADFGGYPTRVTTSLEGVVVDLDGGGILVGLSPHHPHYWIPPLASALDVWHASGGLAGSLGLPTSNPRYTGDEFHQDYERGSLTAPGDLGAPATVVPVDDPGAELAQFESIARRILRQVGEQAFYVDDDLVAHWIPDAETWDCLGGESVLLRPDVSGYAVWSLEMGAPATCELDEA